MNVRDEALLNDLLDERLDAATAAALRARLDAEPALRETWDELRRIRDVVRGAPADRAPPDFLTRVRARIQAGEPTGPADVDGNEHPVDAPAGRLIAFPRRLALAASGIAALLLVALGVRWMRAGDRSEVQGTQVLDSARAPEHDEVEAEALEAVHETLARPPTRGARSSAAPAVAEGSRDAPAAVSEPPAPAAAAPPRSPVPAPVPGSAPAPRPAAGVFGPADAVPPGLRAPSDDADDPDRAPEPRRRGGQQKAADARRLPPNAPPAAFTWTLEVTDLPSGRARLALLVGGLRAAAADERPPLRASRRSDEVLGSVLLCLSADEVAAWDPVAADGKARAARGDAARDVESPDAETESAAEAPACRVRILLVRTATAAADR